VASACSEARDDRLAQAHQLGRRVACARGERVLVCEREVDHPEHAREALAHRGPGGRVGEREEQPRRGAAHAPDGEPGGGALDVLHQAAHEEGPVAPLERDLVIAENDRVARRAHGAVIAQMVGRRR